MWLTGRCGATFDLWLAGPAEGCPGRRRGLGFGRRRRLAQRMVGGRAVWVGQVVTFDMSGSGAVNRWAGRAAECALMLRAASLSVASGRSARTRPVPQGLGVRMEGGVVMGCDEPLARGGGAVERVGAVWFGANRGLPAGISGCAGLLFVGWRAATLSRSCHKRRETWWDGGRYVETISAGRREGRDELGRVNTP
jgi:hypothetical protein